MPTLMSPSAKERVTMARQSTKAVYPESLPDGTKAIVNNRRMPWHTVGQQTDGAATAQEALEMAQLNWQVKVSEDPVMTEVEGKKISLEHKFLTYRNHPKTGLSALGVVGNRYHPIQNEEAFDFINHLVDESGAIYESAGSLGNGERVFMTLKFPETMMFANGQDGVDNYILAMNSHDGSSAFTVAVTPMRIACTNQIRLALQNATSKIALKHTSGAKAKVEQARQTLGIIFKYQESFQKEVEALITRELSDSDYKRFIEKLIPLPKVLEASPRKLNAVEETRSELMGLWKAPTQMLVPNTAWAAYNAVAEYVDWFKPMRGSNEDKQYLRAERNINKNSRLKQRAHELLLTHN
jgi:phage/plasmid-like protein (TIGR03299 family)